MQVTGKLVQLLPIQTGTGKNGVWTKQDIIVETIEQYPKRICVSIWGEKINEGQLQIGNLLIIDFDLVSREYNGRWYNEIKALNLSLISNEECNYRSIVKLVLMALAPESLKMIGCSNSSNILTKAGEELVLPMICSKGKNCYCIRNKISGE